MTPPDLRSMSVRDETNILPRHPLYCTHTHQAHVCSETISRSVYVCVCVCMCVCVYLCVCVHVCVDTLGTCAYSDDESSSFTVCVNRVTVIFPSTQLPVRCLHLRVQPQRW